MTNMASWLDIDLDIISANIKTIRGFIGKTKMLTVVKADAYGHGLVPIALCAVKNGADYLGVSNIEEGITLRQHGINLPILLFNPILPERAEEVVNFNLTATVCSFDLLQALNDASDKLNRPATVHIKVDTGFGRLGVLPEYAVEFINIIKTSFKNIYIEGIYTHFSNASSETTTRKQFNSFLSVLEELKNKNIKIPIRHVCNSMATLKYPDMHLDMVRVGNLIYGLCVPAPNKIMSPVKVFSKIIFIKQLPKGHFVGYGNKYKTKRPTTIAIVPFGYYDGLGLVVQKPMGILDEIKGFIKHILISLGILSNYMKVKVNNCDCNIIGKLGMQNCIIDITGVQDVFIGTTVELNLRKVNINYTLPRVYHMEGKTFTVLRQNNNYLRDELSDGKTRQQASI